MGTITWIDWSVFGIYVGAVFLLGLWFAREQKSNEDFFVGGRTMSWIPIGLSMFASIFSSNSFVGLPTEAAAGTYHTYLAILFIPLVVVPLTAWLFVPFFHRLGVTSAYEYLELRFSRTVRLVASLLFMLYTFFWMGSLLYATGHVIQPVFGLAPDELATTAWILVGVGIFATLYTAMGGFKAVIWTDVLQALALGGGMLCILLLAVGKLDGGWATLLEVGRQHDKFDMFELDLTAKENVFSSAAIGIFVFLPWYAATLTAVQRYVSMPTIRAARQSLVLNGVMVGVVCLLFFLVGTALYVYYHRDLPPNEAGTGFPRVAGEAMPPDQILPNFVATKIQVVGLLGLMMAGLFAAAMSSIDSGINALTAAVVCDWMPGRQLSVTFSRVLCTLFGLGAIGAAVMILYQQTQVYQTIVVISGTFMGMLLGVFLLGMLVPRANTGGSLVGLAAGAVSLAVAWRLEVPGAWYGLLTCVPTFLLGAAASLLFPAPDQRQLTGLVRGYGSPGVLAQDGETGAESAG